MMEALSSSETSVLTRATRRNIPEDAILHDWSMLKPRTVKVMNKRLIKWMQDLSYVPVKPSPHSEVDYNPYTTLGSKD
jgi:hypothetical protein